MLHGSRLHGKPGCGSATRATVVPPPACLEGTESALKLWQCMSRGNPVLCVIMWNGTMQCLHIMVTREIHVVQELKLNEGHDADWIQCWQHLPLRVRAGDILRTCWMGGHGALRWAFRHALYMFGGTTTGATEPSV